MKTLLNTLIALLVALHASVAAAGGGGCTTDGRIDDRVIVHISAGQSLQAFLDQFAINEPDITATQIDQIPGRPMYLLELTLPPDFTPADADALEESLEIDYIGLIDFGELLYVDQTPESNTGSTLVDAIDDQMLYENQYFKGQVGVDAAQTLSMGGGVVVAVVDTGVDSSHPQLAPAIVPGGYNFVDDTTNTDDVAVGADNDGDGLVDEAAGHGTFVAGLIRLVAPNAGILPIRVLDSEGNGDLWLLTEGLYHAIDRGVEVINVSIASTYNSEAVEFALDEAENLGIIVVAAAGNCDNDTRQFPAMRSGALGVAAVNDQDIKAPFSSFSDRLFISAPGDSILENMPDDDRSIISLQRGGGLAYWEGTSMATPIVSGAVALIRAQHPEWPASEFVVDEIEVLLEVTAVDIDGLNPQYQEQLGAGRIDIAAAVSGGPAAPTLGDLDGDGAVNVFDLLTLLSDWDLVHSSADLNGNGRVDVFDLIILLTNWTS